MKAKLLFLLQVPPPIHGASLRNQSIAESSLLKRHFEIKLIPLRFVNEIHEIGSVSMVKFWRFIKFLWRFILNLIIWRPQLIYFSISPIGNAFYRDVLIAIIGRIFNVPFVFHLRGLGISKEYDRSNINKWLYNITFRNNFVFCISKNQLQDIINLPYRKVYIIPDGIRNEINPGPFRQVKVPQILYLSNYIKSKGVLDFVEALRLLNMRGQDFSARLIGAPWDVSNEDLKSLISAGGLEQKVDVGTPLFGADKFSAIIGADIFVLPTYYELFPGVVLEAMQCGKAIVTTITGGIPEIIDDGINGLLAPTRNPYEISLRIETLLKDHRLRENLGRAAREKFLNCFTLEHYETNTMTAFNNVLLELNNY